MKATWNGQVIADSEDTIIVEGNHYFPADAVKSEYLQESATQTTCGWKGVASYRHLSVGGEVNEDAAWFYPDALAGAKNIEGRFAFWKGVEVTE